MSEYFISYAQANIACTIIVGIMLAHDVLGVDRQEKQLKFDRTLVAFMLYFIADTFWAAILTGLLPKTIASATFINFVIFVLMANITYRWLNYVMATLQAPHRNRPINRFAVLFPLLVSAVVIIVMYIHSPASLVDEDLEPTSLLYIANITVPDIYIIAAMFYAFRRARDEQDPVEKRTIMIIGLFPFLIIIGGFIQIALLPQSAIFCLSSTILMIIFYIESMEDQISLDPLTKLNNRGQLRRYVSQESNLHREGMDTYLMMLDINDFKKINDTYGHAEGDKALILTADALRKAVGSMKLNAFISRYGGDEFTIVVHSKGERALTGLTDVIRDKLEEECAKADTPYSLYVAIGYDRLRGEDDTIQNCIDRADRKLYMDKAASKETASIQAS